MSIHVVVMGVAGCGKSTVAEAIHERLGYVYAEGDDFHPQANIDKMSAGIPLTDEDRWPWLNVINSWMVAREALGENTVVSSSALKRSYREVLAKDVPTFFIHLNGSHELIQQRLSERKGHFMPPALLPSQFAILEPLVPEENGVEISIEGSVDEMVDRAIEALNAYAATVAAQTATQAANPPFPSPHVSDSAETDRQNPKPVHVCPIPQKRTNRPKNSSPTVRFTRNGHVRTQNGLPYVRISRIGQI